MPASQQSAVQRRCLIVEDSLFDQRMMARAVMAADSTLAVEVVTSIGEARQALEDGAVEVILLDNNLPDGKGANFAMELAEHARFRRIPVLIVSDWPSPFMWRKAEIAGVRRVLSKAEFNAAVFAAALPGAGMVH